MSEGVVLLCLDLKMKLFCWCLFASKSYFDFGEVSFLGGTMLSCELLNRFMYQNYVIIRK